MLAIDNLTVSYNETKILKEINLQVRDREIVTIIGRNGVGKTTLLKSVMGLTNIIQGQIVFDNVDITSLTPDKRAKMGIGYVPQGREIFPYLTVYENLTVGLKGYEAKTMDEILELFPALKSILKRQGGNLSGGQQQQLAIARVLLREPKLLLMDEPTEGIQPSIVYEIQEAIKKINEQKGVSILLVEQYIDFATKIANCLYVMDVGKIVFKGKPEEINNDLIINHLTI